MGSFKYAFRDAARLIFRHWGLSFLTLITAMAVFYLIGASVLLVLNARHVVGALEGELAIQAYLAPEAKSQDIAVTASKVEHVTRVSIITPEMAMDRLRERLGTRQAEALMIVGANPLPSSLEIWVDRAGSVESVVQKLMLLPEVDDVVYAGKMADKLAKFSRFAGQFSLALLIVSITASAVVLFNTIRIAVFSKEEEIGVMLMVGATPAFVAQPFVVQGVILGGLGSFGASMLLAFSYGSILERLRELMPFLPLLEPGVLTLQLGVILVGAGATLSLVASLVAVETFTRRAMKPL